MKKITITLLMAMEIVLGTKAEEITPTHVLTVPYSMGHALDKDGNLLLAHKSENSDNTVTFYIFNQDLSLAHSFTTKQTFQLKIYNAHWGDMVEFVEDLSDGSGLVDADVILSQTLFNDDDEWEFVITKTTYNNSTQERTFEYTVYNESGTKFDLPKIEGSLGRYYSNGSTQYFGYVIETEDRDDIEYYSAKNSNSVRVAEINESKISVSPNPVPSGQSFAVSFTEALTEACIINILDLNGTSVYSSDIQAGETSKTISGNTLNSGMYIYTVSCGDGIIQSGKIIIQ